MGLMGRIANEEIGIFFNGEIFNAPTWLLHGSSLEVMRDGMEIIAVRLKIVIFAYGCSSI